MSLPPFSNLFPSIRQKVAQMLFLLAALLFSTVVDAQIRVSSDLNCSFSSRCLWQNETQSAIGLAGFLVVSDAIPDKRFPVSDGEEDNFFAYTVGPPGFSGQSSLLSEIVECQLGGAKLKFWHFHSGARSRVEVCMRYPPGSPLPMALHCYAAYGSGRAAGGHQWQMATVELPPMTQPMELLIRATFESPNSLVAIDEIVYEAILCETSHRGAAEGGGGKIDANSGEIRGPLQNVPPQIGQQIHGSGFTPPQGGGIDANSRARSLTALTSNQLLDGEMKDAHNFDGLKDYLKKEDLPTEKREESPKGGMEKIEGRAAAEKEAMLNGAFDCNFDQSSICAYQQNGPPLPKNGHKWMLANRPIANPLTGIQKDHSGGGWFVYAGGAATAADHPGGAAFYLLESGQSIPPESPRPLTLQFFYHMAGARGRLRVCFANSTGALPLEDDGLSDGGDGLCPFLREGWTELTELPAEVDPRAWRKGAVSVPLDSNKVFFLADQLPKNYFVGLDSIRLVRSIPYDASDFDEY